MPVRDLSQIMANAATLADKYITRSGGVPVQPEAPPRPALPEWDTRHPTPNPYPDLNQFSPETQRYILRSGGADTARDIMLRAYPNGPPADDLGEWKTIYSELAPDKMPAIGTAMKPLMAPTLVTQPGSGGLFNEERYLLKRDDLPPRQTD